MSPDAIAPAARTSDSRKTLGRTGTVWGVFLLATLTVGAFLQLSSTRLTKAAPPLPVQLHTAAPAAQPPAASRAERFTASAPRVAPRDSMLDRQRWTAIVIHHSGSPAGDAASIERRHFDAGLAGLGYHFVVGNGQGLDDGQVVVGYRWERQLPGAHVARWTRAQVDPALAWTAPSASVPDADALNQHAIAICLVGNGERRSFTERQLRETVALVRALQAELGIRSEAIYLHSDVAPVVGPGRFFPIGDFRRQLLP